jgi:hypothetical protein
MSRLVNIAAAGNLGPLGKAGSGAQILSITVNKGTATSILTIYDGQDNTGTVRGVIDCAAVRQILYHGAWFKNGFFAVMATANSDVTVEFE